MARSSNPKIGNGSESHPDLGDDRLRRDCAYAYRTETRKLDATAPTTVFSASMTTGPREEMVLAIRRGLFDQLGAFQGLSFDVPRYLPPILARENNFFVPRSKAELDPGLKQIIPYVILTHEGRVLHYVRGKKGGEKRLTAKGSIGIGGHLNDADENLFSFDQRAYLAGVKREVDEELIVQSGYQNHIRALLNDDSNEVGQVHLGIIHVFELSGDQVSKREAQITQLSFLTPEELRARREQLETWSQLCVDHLDQLLSPAT